MYNNNNSYYFGDVDFPNHLIPRIFIMPENNNVVNRWTRTEWEAVQQRAVNPYRAVEARAVNRLTRVVTGGSSVALGKNEIEFVDYKTVKIKANHYVKDDVYVEFTEDISLDMTDDTNYYSESYKGLNSEGTYWFAMIYTFINSIPYPYASFKIIKREEDITDDVLVIGKLEVVADPSVVGGYAVDEDTIEGDTDGVLYVDALKEDLIHAIATRTAVNYEDESLIFTHDDPTTRTDISRLDAQVQDIQAHVNRFDEEIPAMQEDISELQVPLSYDDLYGPGMPLEDLADYKPKPEGPDPEPGPEPEPGPDPEPEPETDPFEISSVYLDAGVLTVGFNEPMNIHDSEMENAVAFVTSAEDHTVVGYPDSYTVEDGNLMITADFTDTDKYIMISAGLLETQGDMTVQENDIVFSLEEYINGVDDGI